MQVNSFACLPLLLPPDLSIKIIKGRLSGVLLAFWVIILRSFLFVQGRARFWLELDRICREYKWDDVCTVGWRLSCRAVVVQRCWSDPGWACRSSLTCRAWTHIDQVIQRRRRLRVLGGGKAGPRLHGRVRCQRGEILVLQSSVVCLLPSDGISADLIKPQSLGFLECASHKILVAVALESCMVVFCKSKERCDTAWKYLQSVSWFFPFCSEAGLQCLMQT